MHSTVVSENYSSSKMLIILIKVHENKISLNILINAETNKRPAWSVWKYSKVIHFHENMRHMSFIKTFFFLFSKVQVSSHTNRLSITYLYVRRSRCPLWYPNIFISHIAGIFRIVIRLIGLFTDQITALFIKTNMVWIRNLVWFTPPLPIESLADPGWCMMIEPRRHRIL